MGTRKVRTPVTSQISTPASTPLVYVKDVSWSRYSVSRRNLTSGFVSASARRVRSAAESGSSHIRGRVARQTLRRGRDAGSADGSEVMKAASIGCFCFLRSGRVDGGWGLRSGSGSGNGVLRDGGEGNGCSEDR